MTPTRLFLAAAVTFSVSACSDSPAERSPDAPASLDGSWQFKTERVSDGYDLGSPKYRILSGTLNIGAGGAECHLSVFQKSELAVSDSFGQFQSASAEESCKIVRNGAAVSITSTVIKPETWSPDNFELQVKGDRMEGTLTSSVDAPAVFVRTGGKGGALPSTLWASEVSDAKAAIAGYKFIGVSPQGCVAGTRVVEKTDGPLRRGETAMICDTRLDGKMVHKAVYSDMVDCGGRGPVPLDVRYFSPSGTEIKQVHLLEADKAKTDIAKMSTARKGSLGAAIIDAICAG